MNENQQKDDLVEPLNRSKHKNRSTFDCGSPALNQYLSLQANQSSKRHAARTYVATDLDDPSLIAGYYTLTTTSVQPENMGPIIAKRYPGLDSCGLIARLAVDITYHGQGLGEALLINAISRLVQLSEGLGFPVIIVDPKNGAADFYTKYGFERFDNDEDRMFLTINDAIKALKKRDEDPSG